MVELTEAEARARRRHVEREDGWPVRYRRIVGGTLESVIYPGWDDPAVPLEDLRVMNLGVRAEIYSSAVTRPANGTRRTTLAPHWFEPPPLGEAATIESWRIWYVTPDGELEKILGYQFDDEGHILRVDYRGPDGELRTYSIYRYDHQGFLIDVVTHAPDGAVLNTEDAP